MAKKQAPFVVNLGIWSNGAKEKERLYKLVMLWALAGKYPPTLNHSHQ